MIVLQQNLTKIQSMFFTELNQIILAFLLGISIVIAVIPPIIKVAREKKLFDCPDYRKIHKQEIPPLGGIAIFMGFLFSSVFLWNDFESGTLNYMILAVVLLLFIGLKDDLIGISPIKKFGIQFVATVILIFMGEVHITSLHGLFGVYEVNIIPGSVISLFILLTLINAFNLIDGIDGLAAGLGMLASLIFGFWFYLAGLASYAIISFALLGSLSGFFLFNVFGKSNKLFMGDTGSLFLGLIIAILTIKFNEFNARGFYPYTVNFAPVFSFAVVMIPLVDVLRVIVIRLLSGKSPFYPDKNHIHHKLLHLLPGSHLMVTLILIGSNVFLIVLAFLLNSLEFNIHFQFMSIFFAGITLAFIPSFLAQKGERRMNKQIKLNELQTWPD
jgi:UDP-GlcNAc:undecaprenyl-phosphate/decaprenyl-phosphate GlcNAc-1-phosphate transferase